MSDIVITYEVALDYNGMWNRVDHRLETKVNGEYKPELYTIELICSFAQRMEDCGLVVHCT